MGCEGLRASIEVVVSTAARPSGPSPLTYCQNAVAVPLTATAGSASDTLFWYTSATGGTGTKTAPTPVTTAAGTFYYYVSGKTSLACEGDRDTVAVIVNPAAGTPVAPSPVTYCQNAMAVPLTATPDIDIDTLLWFTGATGGTGSKTAPTPSTAAAGSVFYYVGAKTEAGCQGGRDTIEVITYPAAASPSAPSPVNYCQGATASALTATKGSATDTLLWYTSATGGTGSKTAPTPSTAATGTTFYYGSGKTNKGCEGARDTIEVNVYPPAAMPTAPSPVTYCQSATAVPLTATAGSTTDTLLWYTVATGGTGSKTAPTPSTAAAGSKFYYVSAKTLMGCEGKRDTIEVIVKAAATPVVSSPVNYCQGAAAVPLTATKGSTTDTLYWYTSATAVTGSKTAPTPSTAAAGTSSYYVSVRTTANCESPRAKIDVQVNAPASQPVAASPLNLCQGATAAALTATKGSSTDTLFWYTSPTGGTGSKTAPTPSTASTGTSSYYVSAKSNKGCEGTRDTIDVIVNPVPAVPTVSTPVVYCQNATASALTAGKGSASDTLFWYTAATGGTGSKTAPTPSTASTGTSSRYVSAKNTFGCESNRAKIDITINPKGATPGVTSPVHYCRGDAPMPLTATAGSSSDTLYWYTAASGGTGTKAAPTPSTATAGTTKYYVSARTSLGCEGDRATIEVQVHPPADTPGVSTPLVYCRNDKAFALSASMGLSSDTLLWYTSATGGTPSRTAPIPSTATDGTTYYYVSAKSSFGCEGGRDTIAVVVNPLPVVSVSSLSPTGTIRCRNIDSIVLKATAPTALSYQWYYEVTPQPGATRDTVHARASGYWYAVVTDAKGCRGKDSLWVQRDTLEEPVLTPPDNKICIGGSVLLTCSPGYVVNRFRWYRNGILLPAIPVTRSITSVSDTGSYTVSMTNAAGCTYKTNTARVEYYPPTPKPKLVYTPPVLSVSGGSYRAYQWYQDMKWLFGATGSTYTVTDEGDYYVEVTDVNGCTSKSDTLYIQPPTSLGPQYATLQLKLYPNPTSSVVRIDAPIKVNVMVTDLSGKPVLPVQEAQTVDLKDLADGSYFFRITDEHGQLLGTEKIQKISR